jgi:succinyl-CoA synthetase alpha subunit
MAVAFKTLKNFYRDSVSLMQVSARVGKLPGIRQASAVMASPANLALLAEAKLLPESLEAGPNDLLVVMDGEDAATEAAWKEVDAALATKPRQAAGGPAAEPPRSLEMGLAAMPGANLALIATPGAYATAEAMKALALGLHVMMFSDNVPGEDEVKLKTEARQRGLLVMGPDCGTAIIGGIPLGFANKVRRGSIGVVAASGTGLQQVTCLIDRMGSGISEAIGTGGHDLAKEVGGITMLAGLEALAEDPGTETIVLISKPPAPEVAAKVIAAARDAGKPVVVNFLGAHDKTIEGDNLTAAATLQEAAEAAVALATGRVATMAEAAAEAAPGPFAASQKYVRGLFTGGTFCYEAALILSDALAPVFTNTPVGQAAATDDPWTSRGHTLIDFGDDVFTRGRPHPMIDPGLRNERILAEADDPETAILLLDVVIGSGAHDDPAAEIVPAIRAAMAAAAAAGRTLAVIGFVCGTEGDPQNLRRQEAELREAGVILAGSNTDAARLAARIAGRIT